MVADLKLEETGAGLDLLPGSFGPVLERGRRRVLDSADEERRRRVERSSGEVVARSQSGCHADELRPVQIEDAPGFGLVARGHVVPGQAADVLDAVERGADDVGLAGNPVLVPAHDLQDRLDARLNECDCRGDVRDVRVGGGVVRRVHRVDPRRHLRDAVTERVLCPPVDCGRLAGEDEPVTGLDEFLKAAHAASPSGSAVHPAGVTRARFVMTFVHDEVPSSRLSTGGRSSLKCPRQAAGRSGRVRDRSSALTQTQRISGTTSQVPSSRTPPHGPFRNVFGQVIGHVIPVSWSTH